MGKGQNWEAIGGGVGGMLYTLRPEGGALAAKYSYANGRGDVVAQANQGGAVTWTASYEAFGTRKLETGTNVDRQRANTKEEDPTGLLNEGFRYRDLETGTWLSRDPAGFVDGPNLYAYVKCNPWTAWDPEGLSAYSDFSDAAARDIAEGRSVRGYTKAVIATAWNTMSFGLAESAGGIQDSYQADEISGRQALAQAAMATGGAVKDAAQTYAGGALKGLGAAGKALNGVARGGDALDTAEGLVATGRELAAGNADGLKGKVLGAAVGAGLGKLAAKKPTGSYTNTHESGKKYHGKGTEDRMNTSAKEKAAEHGDPVVEQDFKPAANRREAFKDEARRIREDGGVENPNNYNKINSPGEKYLKQDDE